MDLIIVFKEGKSLKEEYEKIRFSAQRAYKIYISTIYEQMGKILKENTEFLLFYHIEDLQNIDRLRLTNLKLNYPNVKICLCSDKKYAIDAWKMNLFHFVNFPVSSSDIFEVYIKFIHMKGGIEKELILKDNEGIHKIGLDDICYFRGAGNYTYIQLASNNHFIQTKQLGNYSFICEKDLNFVRIHKSLIINLKRIKTLGYKKIEFYSGIKPLDISTVLEKRLKQKLLGLKN